MNKETCDISITINGRLHRDRIPTDLRLVDYLREYKYLTGTKKGCGCGECGACTVIMNGEPVYSCITLAIQADGAEIRTIEGLSDGNTLHPIQEAFLDAGAVQCGFCTPGMIMTTAALLEENPAPDEREIEEALAGNLCRCTGYRQIADAVKLAAERIYGRQAVMEDGELELRGEQPAMRGKKLDYIGEQPATRGGDGR